MDLKHRRVLNPVVLAPPFGHFPQPRSALLRLGRAVEVRVHRYFSREDVLLSS
jgi:hypothetical protein